MKRFWSICADPGIPLPGTKGSSIHVESVTRAFVRRGLDGTVYAARPTSSELAGLPLHRLDAGLELPKPAPKDADPADAARTTRARELELLSRNVPLAVSDSERPDWIYERYSLWHLGGLLTARRLDVPFILEVNAPLPLEAARYRSLAHPGAAAGIAEVLCTNADGIVCVSREVAHWVESQRGDPEGIWVIPNGVDLERFDRATDPIASPFANDDPVILFVGSFRPWHGLDRLIEAFRLVRDRRIGANLLLVGDGPLRASLERECAERGLADRIHWTGAVAPDDVPRWGRLADLAVAPYPDDERFYFSPIKIFEFQALHLPVVASHVGQIPELVAHAETGWLVDPRSVEALAQGLIEMIGDPARRAAIGSAARRHVADTATWNHRASEILARIEEVA